MSILIDETSRVLIQGFTGDKGTFHAKEMIAYGTKIVGGVTPGKGGVTHLGLPVFNTVKEAVKQTGATHSIAFVAPAFCADAIMEAADAGIGLVCSITDGIPAQDMMRVKRYLLRYQRDHRTLLVGPNCAGIISPGKAMLGIMPGHIYVRGTVGVVSRSGTLGYEAAAQMKALGIGVSTSVGIGGDPINGSSFLDHLVLFERDLRGRRAVPLRDARDRRFAAHALGLAAQPHRGMLFDDCKQLEPDSVGLKDTGEQIRREIPSPGFPPQRRRDLWMLAVHNAGQQLEQDVRGFLAVEHRLNVSRRVAGLVTRPALPKLCHGEPRGGWTPGRRFWPTY